MIHQDSPRDDYFRIESLAITQAAKTGRAQCDGVSLYRCNAILYDDKDKFQENEAVLIVTGLDSSVTAASVKRLTLWDKSPFRVCMFVMSQKRYWQRK